MMQIVRRPGLPQRVFDTTLHQYGSLVHRNFGGRSPRCWRQTRGNFDPDQPSFRCAAPLQGCPDRSVRYCSGSATGSELPKRSVACSLRTPRACPSEHVATALTGCVITKDELESLLDGMGLVYAVGGITGIFDRVKWIRKEQDMQRLVQRLQNHKASLNLILTIFQCSSVSQIQDSVSRLSALIEEAVTNSSVLSTRLSQLEGSSTLGYPTSETSIINDAEPTNANDPEEPDGDDASVRTITQLAAKQSQNESQLVPASFAFEPELQVSRLYRKLELLGSDRHSETSITTSARQRTAASIFSKLSLADISNLSQYSLPILIQEIRNNRWYIQVGRMSESGEFVATTSGINFNVTSLSGKRKSYLLTPSDTAYRLKEMIQNDDGLPPDWIVLVYTLPGGTLRKLQDEKSFSEQGIASTHPTARVYILLPYRGRGSHYPDTINEEERRHFRHVIHRGNDGQVVFERFYGG